MPNADGIPVCGDCIFFEKTRCMCGVEPYEQPTPSSRVMCREYRSREMLLAELRDEHEVNLTLIDEAIQFLNSLVDNLEKRRG